MSQQNGFIEVNTNLHTYRITLDLKSYLIVVIYYFDFLKIYRSQTSLWIPQ